MESPLSGIAETDHDKTFIERGNIACNEWVGRIDRGHSLKIYMRA